MSIQYYNLLHLFDKLQKLSQCALSRLKSFCKDSIQVCSWKERRCLALIETQLQLRSTKLWYSSYCRNAKLRRILQIFGNTVMYRCFQRIKEQMRCKVEVQAILGIHLQYFHLCSYFMSNLLAVREALEERGLEEQNLIPKLVHPTTSTRQSNVEVVKTYRKAVFQGGGDSVVYKTFMLVRRPKSNQQQSVVEKPAKRTVQTSKPRVIPLLERIQIRLADAQALSSGFHQRNPPAKQVT